MDNHSRITSLIVGGVFVVIGTVLLSSIFKLVSVDNTYPMVVPLALVVGGISLIRPSSTGNRALVGLLIMSVGLLDLLFRLDFISEQVRAIVVGIIVLVLGIMLVTRLGDKLAVKNPPSDENNTK